MIEKKIKKALVFVPHQDDEINIAGGLIPKLIKEKINVKVIYSTNGDYSVDGKTRIKECIKALKILGVSKENIVLMGYSDQYSKKDTHLFLTDNNNVWKSEKGYTETYHPLGGIETAMKYNKKHSLYNKENFVNDIKSILLHEEAELLFCIDFDSHADHRALSLAFEEALGAILNEKETYRPNVYKAFAYPTSYFGFSDLKEINIKKTKFNTERFSYCEMENPYYSYDKRVRIPLEKKSISKILYKNSTYKALKCHKSQCIIGKTASIINGDQIFWRRNTKNLLYDAEIKVSSGNKKRLNDFMLFNCKNIMKGNIATPKLDAYSWIPNENDISPEINVSFKAEKTLSEIRFYQSLYGKIKKVLIIADNNYNITIDFNDNDNINIVKLNNIKTQNIKIKILMKENNNSGFSEIEIIAPEKQEIKYLKSEINGNFAYTYYYNSEEEFRVYAYDGQESRYLNSNEYELIGKNIEIKDNRIIFKGKKEKITVKLKENERIYDEITIIKLNVGYRFINYLININNKICITTCYYKQKILKKIRKIKRKLKSLIKIGNK